MDKLYVYTHLIKFLKYNYYDHETFQSPLNFHVLNRSIT